ncbi:UNVERIFIED_CONTAM: Tetraketide alpha-pyrone reductase 1 [Sesamum radiatum]|uniref:Dihydroflavonol 4-reductase n=1 Tax=Sesamum radiatum TaxID=300843 RepID=A0AAW2VK94_SESRA
MSGAGKVVCVTGASGFIASWLVKLLLERGYTVKATVRNLNDPKKVVHLKALEGAAERLHLVQADLIEDGSFDSVVDGCEGVFHTASPVFFSTSDPQAELIEPAVKGTLNILRSCSKVTSVRRVVVTSSMASVSFNDKPKGPDVVIDETWFSDPAFCEETKAELIEPAVKGTLNVLRSCSKVTSVRRVVVTSSVASVLFNDKPKGPDVVVDETWFSDPAFCEETKNWYPLSKTLAEKAAWKFAEENGIDLVSMHPGLVLGPLLQPTLNWSSEAFLDMIKGKEVFPTYRFVDVRDVAYAHIMAFENPSASGRYCLVGTMLSHPKTLQVLDKLYPSLNIPVINGTDNPIYQFSKKKAESLGIKFMPLEVSFKDTLESLKEKNFLTL